MLYKILLDRYKKLSSGYIVVLLEEYMSFIV